MMMKHLSRTIALLLSMTMLVTCLLPAAFAEQPSTPPAVDVSEGLQEETTPAEPTQAPTEPEQSEETQAPLQTQVPAESEPPVQTEPPAQAEQPEGDEAPADPLDVGEETEATPEFAPYYAQPEDALPLFAAPELDGEPFGTLAQGVVYVAEKQDETALYIQYAEALPEAEPALRGAWVDAALLTPLTAEQLDEYTQLLHETQEPLCYADEEKTIALLALAVTYPTQEENESDLLAQQETLATRDAPALTSIRITGAGSISKDGGTAQLAVSPVPATATLGTVEWSFTEPSGLEGLVADVSDNGLVTAKGNGKITVTATVEGTQISNKKTISISRQVVPTTGISLSAPATTLIAGKTMVITPTYAPLTATDKKLTWTVAQGADYASVSSSGKVSLKAKAFTDATENVVVRAALKSDPENIYADYALTAYPKPTAVTLNDNTAVTLYLYQDDATKPVPTVTRTASIAPSVLSACDEILWKSSSTKIATVNENGVVTPVKAGKVTITAYSKAYSSVKATYTVTVVFPVEGITLAGKNGQSTLLEGKSLSMQATLSPKNATNKKLSWGIRSVVDANGDAIDTSTQAVTLSKSGVLKALKNTTTATFAYPLDVTLRATALGADPTNNAEGIGFAETTIKIWRPVTTLTITAPKAIIDPGNEDKTLQLDVSYGATASQVQTGVLWTSSNKKVATVDENGLVTAAGKIGTTTITAKAKDGSNKSAKLVVRVGTPVSEITLTGDAAVPEKKSITLTAAVTPANATVKKLTWTTTDKTIATVSSSGKVTAKKKGTVTITAAATDGSGASASKVITVAPLPTGISIIANSLTADTLLDTCYLVEVGSPVSITATVLPDDAAKTVTWKSSSTAIAMVAATDTGCTITPNKAGVVTITATTVNGKTDRITIRVKDAKAYAAPTGLSAEDAGNGIVKLAWQHAYTDHAPSRYTVYRQNDDKKTWSEVATTVLTECTLTRQPKGAQVYSVVPQVKITETTYEDGERATFEAITIAQYTIYRALLVAQSDYPGTVNDLNATDDDVRAMKEVLSRGSTAYEVTAKYNIGEAAITSAINSTFADATEDDVSLFFYSGHGAYDTDDNERGALFLVDNNSITGKELADALSTVPGKVIVILESCYSGNMIWDGTTMSLAQDDDASLEEQQADVSAFNNAIIEAFSAYDDMTLQSGELRQSKFHVITAAAYNREGLESAYNGNGFGFLTFGLCQSVGYLFEGYSSGYTWGGTFAGDLNSDNIISLSEGYTYANNVINSLYEGMYEDGENPSVYPNQNAQVYPAGSTQPLFFKKN